MLGKVFAATVSMMLLVAQGAIAQEYAQAQTEGEQKPADAQDPPKHYAVPDKQQSMSVVGSTAVNNQNDLSVLGLWVGNMAFKVAQDRQGKLYTVSPNGTRKRLPEGTDVNNVTVPENSPLIQGLLRSPNAPRVIEEVKDQSGKIIQPQIRLGETGLLVPKVIGTRTMIVHGRPMVMGGAIVSEVPDWRERLRAHAREHVRETAYTRAEPQEVAVTPPQKPVQHTEARVITQHRTIQKKKVKSKQKPH